MVVTVYLYGVDRVECGGIGWTDSEGSETAVEGC